MLENSKIFSHWYNTNGVLERRGGEVRFDNPLGTDARLPMTTFQGLRRKRSNVAAPSHLKYGRHVHL